MVTEMIAVTKVYIFVFMCGFSFCKSLLMLFSLIRQDKDLSSLLLSLSVFPHSEVKGRKRKRGCDCAREKGRGRHREIREKERMEGSVGRRGIT